MDTIEARALGIVALSALLAGGASAQVDLRVRAEAPGEDARNLNGEYVVVLNRGTVPLDVSGWRLCDAVLNCFVFPDGTTIGPGGDLHVRTGSGEDDLRTLYMGSDRPIWDDWADVATLTDREGDVRARCQWDRGRGVDCVATVRPERRGPGGGRSTPPGPLPSRTEPKV